jgi:hypothetical protein
MKHVRTSLSEVEYEMLQVILKAGGKRLEIDRWLSKVITEQYETLPDRLRNK